MLIATIAMTDMGNQAGNGIWPSLEAASTIFDRAGFVLIGSLGIGTIATVLIVWMGIVKERHWEAIREASTERVAALELETAKAKEETAKATESAARANERAEEARSEQERIKAQIAWRRITAEQHASLVTALQIRHSTIVVGHASNDPEAVVYAEDIARTLRDAGWTVHRTGFISPQPMFGLELLPATDADVGLVVIFAAAGIDLKRGPVVPAAIGLTLNVWNKPPPF